MKSINIEEILQEAIRRYPIGTKYITAYNNDDTTYEVELDDDIFTITDVGIMGATGKGYIYVDGKWAEIIESNYEIY